MILHINTVIQGNGNTVYMKDIKGDIKGDIKLDIKLDIKGDIKRRSVLIYVFHNILAYEISLYYFIFIK